MPLYNQLSITICNWLDYKTKIKAPTWFGVLIFFLYSISVPRGCQVELLLAWRFDHLVVFRGLKTIWGVTFATYPTKLLAHASVSNLMPETWCEKPEWWIRIHTMLHHLSVAIALSLVGPVVNEKPCRSLYTDNVEGSTLLLIIPRARSAVETERDHWLWAHCNYSFLDFWKKSRTLGAFFQRKSLSGTPKSYT